MTDENKMPETWKDIPEHEGLYQVSSLGRVKSLERYAIMPRGRERLIKERYLSACDDGGGYLQLNLSKNGKSKISKVHKLVSRSFLGEPNGLVVNHIDGDRRNNIIENIEYVSVRENTTHGKNTKKTYTGARFHKRHNRWYSHISIKGVKKYLGCFKTEKEAAVAYKDALTTYGVGNKYAK